MSLERTWHQRDDQANRQSMGHLQCSWHASGTQAISQGQSLVSLEACHSTEISYGTAHLRKSQQDHVMSANQFSKLEHQQCRHEISTCKLFGSDLTMLMLPAK